MALDFTVVIQVRQRFGNQANTGNVDIGLEFDAPFVGTEKEYRFQCRNVDSNQTAILLYQTQGVGVRQRMEINGQQIFGGIPASTDVAPITHISPPPGGVEILKFAQWNGNVMLVHPGVLKPSNVLLIRAENLADGQRDNFIIDNLVVLFKTRRGS